MIPSALTDPLFLLTRARRSLLRSNLSTRKCTNDDQALKLYFNARHAVKIFVLINDCTYFPIDNFRFSQCSSHSPACWAVTFLDQRCVAANRITIGPVLFKDTSFCIIERLSGNLSGLAAAREQPLAYRPIYSIRGVQWFRPPSCRGRMEARGGSKL